MTIDEIERLLRAFDHSGVTGLTVKTADGTVKMTKATPPSPVLAADGTGDVPVCEQVTTAGSEALALVQAPLAGTYYAAPSETAEPFVQVGDRVEVGQTIAVIEAMKVMNEVPSTVSGQVVAILPENGSVIGYHETILQVDTHV